MYMKHVWSAEAAYTFKQGIFLQGWFCGLLIILQKDLYIYERERERERDREKLWMMKEKNLDLQCMIEAKER